MAICCFIFFHVTGNVGELGWAALLYSVLDEGEPAQGEMQIALMAFEMALMAVILPIILIATSLYTALSSKTAAAINAVVSFIFVFFGYCTYTVIPTPIGIFSIILDIPCMRAIDNQCELKKRISEIPGRYR